MLTPSPVTDKSPNSPGKQEQDDSEPEPMTTLLEALQTLGHWTADQWGLVTTAQARQDGITANHLRRLTQAGLLTPAGHGTHQLTGAPTPRHLEVKVAWLRLDPATPAWQRLPNHPDSGVVSHASACQLHELGDLPIGIVEITTPRRRTTRDRGMRLHTAQLCRDDITIVDGLPVTTPARTILDLLQAPTDGGHVGGVLVDAAELLLMDVEAFAARALPLAKIYGLPPTATGRQFLDYLAAQAGQQMPVCRHR